MAKKGKNREKKQPPVSTGHDERSRRREEEGCAFRRESDAPDGVTGNWS